MKPRIGLSVNYEEKGTGKVGAYLGADYTDGIYAAGGLPFVLPLTDERAWIEELADELDGLLLTGGDDIDPSYFGHEPLLGLGQITPLRDAMEFQLFAAMRARQKPIFGICRGVQVMNAALGGTLYQDLPREYRGTLQHSQKAPRDHMAHAVEIAPGTRLAQIVEVAMLPVNTYHHQAVRDLAPGCVATAHSRDGLIEAIECPTDRFTLGVQWHPENLWRKNSSHFRLFTAFTEAAAAARREAAQKQPVFTREEK